MLPVYLLLRKTFHHHPDWLIWTERYNAESFGLTIGSVLKELHILKIGDTDIRDRVRNILVRCPLEKVLHKTQPRCKQAANTHKSHTSFIMPSSPLTCHLNKTGRGKVQFKAPFTRRIKIFFINTELSRKWIYNTALTSHSRSDD